MSIEKMNRFMRIMAEQIVLFYKETKRNVIEFRMNEINLLYNIGNNIKAIECPKRFSLK